VRWPVSASFIAAHRLEIPHLTDQHHVGVLAERGAKRHREALRVGVELALVDQARLVVVQVFDRVLNREDVRRLGQVDPVDHRRQRRGLAAAGRPRDEDQATRPIGHFRQHRRQPQFVERADFLRDEAQDGADRALLVEDVAAEAADAAQAEGEVELPTPRTSSERR
jgi:hypothetical protein